MSNRFSGAIEQKIEGGKIVVNFVDGKKQGITKAYRDDGTVLSEIPYENNEIHGELKQYYPNGSLLVLIEYKNGIQSGKFVSFFENGMKMLEAYYQNGVFHGKFITFDEYGDKTSESLYKNGMKNGKSIKYYPQSKGGGICELSHYDENGLLTGELVLLSPRGEITSATPYKNGRAQAYPKNGIDN